ncbi:hypothetical protein [Prescottella equi]|uniref:hypothetical protein n=1 Tax=Rhodococcus hoagii TaxID=43767 RepID=UPI00111C58BF|nr:hypothetical protein [Prescottella equi]
METQTNTQTLSEIIGMNARRLRLAAGVTLEQLATTARLRGLNWSTGRVGDLESGRVQATLPTLLALAASLAEVTGRPVELRELLESDGPAEITGLFAMDPLSLAAVLSGKPFYPDPTIRGYVPEGVETAEQHMANATVNDLVQAHGWSNKEEALRDLNLTDEEKLVEVLLAVDGAALADRRAAKALGVDLPELTAAAFRCWGKPLSEQREELAGTDATNQHRGQITRDLYAALRIELGQVK